MVGQMTYGKRQFESLDAEMRKLIPPFHEAMNDLLLKVDADSTAFNSYMVHNQTQTTFNDFKKNIKCMNEFAILNTPLL